MRFCGPRRVLHSNLYQRVWIIVRKFWFHDAFVFSVLRHKVPQMGLDGGASQQSWSLAVQDQGVTGLVLSEASLLVV